ncbi:NHL repeat-containing protein [Sphingomonas nostoxanthinifaciens]|uniref:hypothetical protein n=1 Tax=Sphingomonas nostoxanthinifaciens TaxID=2872652 RepID=UPI001CC201C0|nr:hypothetical protein [Sphingomonas nostoxanthinifaciens]UAK25908.1 hypothetical protein K8P63_07240 [Sphingomonas nostoxanthinifaciens]
MFWLPIVLAAAAVTSGPAAEAAPPAMPVLVPDAGWLKLPADMMLGDVSAVAVDAHDNLWVLHRPRSLPETDRAKAAPPVVMFDGNGHYLRGFGGPGAGYDWPTTEHSIAVDREGRVWIGGNSRGTPADDMILVFTTDGRFLRQIGKPGASQGDADTANLHAPADIFVDDHAHETYVADGYGNRRIIVFDADTGAFKRMWSAFGAPPPADPAPNPRAVGAPFVPETGDGPQGFNGVHAVELSRDGLVYVADRNDQRIQVFTRAGRYLRQTFVDRNQPSPQTASSIAFSPDVGQRIMYVSDWGNSRLLAFDRKKLALLGTIGGKGSEPGQFSGPHLIATDSRGVLYVAEVAGRRVQRLVPRR